MAQRRAAQLTIGYSPDWLQQSAWDVPIPGSDLTKAFPAISRNYIDVETTAEDVDDCTGENLLLELVTAETAKLNIDVDFDPDIVAGLEAFAYGVAAAPTGGSNEVQTETITATGGSRTLTVQVGADAQTTAPIPYNAVFGTIQTALEALSNVGTGDIVVTGTGPFIYTFSGTGLQKRDANLISVNTFGLTGGTSTMVETTPGVGLTHAISRLIGYTLPLMTLYIGFRGSDKQPIIFKNVVVNSIRVRSASREKVSCTVELIGSGELNYATGYTMPDCQDLVPLRFGDCKVSIGGTDFIASNLCREFEYYFQNDVKPKFDGAGIYSTRHERADKRVSQISTFILGEPGDALYNLAKARTMLDTFIQCGPDGRNVKFIAPGAIVKLAPTPIRFGGDPLESEMAIIARPKKVIGNAATPTNVTAVIGTSVTLLTSA
ncbi:MAG: hypothetical protein ABJA67_12840 [Chthonomonadales bacterium]